MLHGTGEESAPLRIRGAQVYDGHAGPPIEADVITWGGRIRLAPPGQFGDGEPEETVIDACGLALAPGFIDAHTHSDALALLPDVSADLSLAPVRQGVTTEVAGNCGSSLFPAAVSPELEPALRSLIETLFGEDVPRVADMADFAALHRNAPRLNHIATLVGHSVLRAAVVGFEQRPATVAELDQMCALLDAALSAGAVGLSCGLIYPPGVYASTDEMVALAGVAAAHGKPYVTHMRDEMSKVEQALAEAIDIARRSGAAVHVSHHKTAGRCAWGRTTRTLVTMDAARAEGLDVTCDVYPYTAGSTNLHAMFPPWALAGGIPALLERLASTASRDAIRASIAAGEPGWENTVGNGGWDRIEIAHAEGHPETHGRSIAELAAVAGQDPVDYAADLLVAERSRVTIISRSMIEDDVRRVLAHPGTMVGSDGIPKGGLPHPRWAGSFARVLGRYVREEGTLTLAEAVARMTLMPARRFGLHDRGRIEDGARADLVLFDPATVLDQASFEHPLRRPTGIRNVIVSGVPVVIEGQPTGAHPGGVVLAEGSRLSCGESAGQRI